MLVFIDESGDTGRKIDKGSSKYFVIALVTFEDNEEAVACDQRIHLLRKELRLPENYEFKFSKLRKEQREAFLRAVNPYSFFYFGIVINKDPKKLYGSGSREFKRQFQSYLKKKVGTVIKKVKIQSSHSNNLIQLADMVVGAIHRGYGQKEDKKIYRSIIKPREIKVQAWPSNNNDKH